MRFVHGWLQLAIALASSFHYSAAAERWGKESERLMQIKLDKNPGTIFCISGKIVPIPQICVAGLS